MQFSLFEKRPLFDDETLHRRENEWRTQVIDGFEESRKPITEFIKEVQLRNKRGTKETALEQEFNRAFFVRFLGYSLYPGVDGQWSAWPKPPTRETGLAGEPDILLGNFREDSFDPAVVVELKRPGTNLDAPQPGYDGRTPVEQAFQYARRLSSCQWVIVSDMRLIRLYSSESDGAFHEVDLWTDTRSPESILRECWHLLAKKNLAEHANDAPTLRLLHASQERQFRFRDGFYRIYSDIRADLVQAIGVASPATNRVDVVQSSQRLLDRLLFIYFCEDHPDRLLPRNLLRDVLESAVRQPGPSTTKAYDALKGLFRDLDEGRDTQFWKVPKYNGELFKPHPLLDNISLPDDLYGKSYSWASNDGRVRRNVQGVYGLHVFDFWRELDRDLLGNVFERSIGDLEDIALGAGGRKDARSAFGIFYTSSKLAQFAATSVIAALLEDNNDLTRLLNESSGVEQSQLSDIVEEVFSTLKSYRIVDLACGSGVFLTTALDALLVPYRKVLEAGSEGPLTRQVQATRQAEILKAAIYGDDLLPQAVELAKLALWLTAARKGEPSADLTANFNVGDTLNNVAVNRLKASAGSNFHATIGNPPWGGELDELHVPNSSLDSWEVFLRRAVDVTQSDGRVGFLVPDSFFYNAKVYTRRWLVDETTLEKVYLLGPDWFGPKVRMSTVFLQLKKSPPAPNHRIRTLLLAGEERLRAQSGRRPLQQAEESSAGWYLQKRARADAQAAISVLVSDEELPLLDRIKSTSVNLESITERGRGDELSASGLVWRCGNCATLTVPGEKAKGGGFKSKSCGRCGATLEEAIVEQQKLVASERSSTFNIPYIDGLGLTRRYQNPPRKFIRTDLPILPPLKSDAVFIGPKILIRQAGVGITATVVEGDDRFPQSIYTYRPKPSASQDGYSAEFILACLCSRVMNYFHMKTSGEVDPAKAFSKLTHARLASFPIPRLDSDDRRKVAQAVATDAKQMLGQPRYGGEVDFRIERRLQELWDISPDEGRYINGFFFKLPSGQAVRDLFPDGPPSPVPYPAAFARLRPASHT